MKLIKSVPRISGDATAFLASSMLMVATVEVVHWVGRRRPSLISPRKILHVAAGPVFLFTWPWFTVNGKFHAALVPLCMTLKFAGIGLGFIKDDNAVKTMSRTGDRRELLKGPLIYGCVFVAATLAAFRQPVAAAALMSLCFGDAAAEIVGQKYGKHAKLPWSRRKSYAGSIGFVLSSTVAMSAFVALFKRWGFVSSEDFALQIILSSVVGALVESLPMPDVDNVLVPAAVAATFCLTTKQKRSREAFF